MQYYSYLDKIRMYDGNDKLKSIFHEIFLRNKYKGISLLNDKYITFSSLFILLSEIESLNLYEYLNHRNLLALKISQQILKSPDSNNEKDYLSVKTVLMHRTLKWMLRTGYREDGLSDEYEEILEVVISILINNYRDRSILPIVTNMIFKRNKEGLCIHDLVWAFFKFHDVYSLRLIAKRILSPEEDDVKLACDLLDIVVPDVNNTPADNQEMYNSYLKWIKENDPFLYFTGESFQFSSHPIPCLVDLDRKYMYKGTPSYDKKSISRLNDFEYRCLEDFESLSNEDKIALSEYSYKFHNKNISKWKNWIHSPIATQIKIAKNEMEGYQ